MVLVITCNAFAGKTPEELMDNYIKDFNTQKLKKVERNYSFPLIVIQNSKKTIHNEISTFLNFKKIRATGWEKSVINSVKTILKKDKSAITQLNFSRINKEGIVYLTLEANYILIRENENWYISGIIIDGNTPLGIENN
tara:strand:+ start:1389 stop:1805 length:417 start_codon:yes stop_codon:yes gene_type:complete